MRELVSDVIAGVLRDFQAKESEGEPSVGPSTSVWTIEEHLRRISGLLDANKDEAPYTLQRLW